MHIKKLSLWAVLLFANISTLLPIPANSAIVGLIKPLEAEKAALQGANIANNHPDFTGTGFVDYVGEGHIEWTVNIAQTGLYQLEFRYALASGNRPLDIYGNSGILIKSNLPFNATGSFDTWKTVSVFVHLDAGQNKIRAVTRGSSGANIDHLVVSLTPPDPNKFLTFPIHSSHAIFSATNSLDNAQAYYRSVDPGNEKTNFNDWRISNNFPANCGAAQQPNCFFTVYLNSGDLNLGRRMFVYTKANGDVASYVENYPTLRDAIAGTKKIATVSMEYAAPPDGSAGSNFTTFFVFQDKDKDGIQERVTSVDLDGRGEKYVPGVCNVCHGGKPKLHNLEAGSPNYPDHGDTGAKWIPWDLDAFKFDPSRTRAQQQAQFKAMNRTLRDLYEDTVNRSGVAVSGAAATLIDGWYGGAGMPSATFNGNFVPSQWLSTADGNKSNLYLNVVAPACRSCHLQRGSINNSGNFFQGDVLEQSMEFMTYDHFKSYRRQIEPLIYDMGAMPIAKRTFEIFWRSDMPKILDNELYAGQAYQNPGRQNVSFVDEAVFGAFRRPGRPIPNIAGLPMTFGKKEILPLGNFCFQGNIYSLMDVPQVSLVSLNARPSLFAGSVSWSFVNPNSFCSDTSGPVINGATSAKASFSLDPAINSDIQQSGTPYYVRLAVTNEFAQNGGGGISGYNNIIVGQLFSNSSLQPLFFNSNIYPLLAVNANPSTRSSTPLTCVHCHSDGNVVNSAHGVFDMMDFNSANANTTDAHRREFAYKTVMTRVNCADPENSLILKKPAGHHHYNGTTSGFENPSNAISAFNFNSGDSNSRTKILRWIMEGAKFDAQGTYSQFSCSPPRLRFINPDLSQFSGALLSAQ